ncbi:uncharacterized protein [Diadema antillarum]|uniref:uncharacterized protein n=1 Tax=Diadema antillarum TaxID=105358 RepID=UPI003A86389C
MAFSKRLRDPSVTTFSDFSNPWNFFGLFGSLEEEQVWEWLRDNGLVAKSMFCEVCGQRCTLQRKTDRRSGHVWRCRRKGEQPHDKVYCVTKHSFFEHTHFNVRDIMLFMWLWLFNPSLKQVSNMSGVGYSVSSVNWANYMRDLCKQFVHDLYYEETEKLRGEIELDESFFGRRCKFHRGNPNPGHKVWIFGMVERSTNRLIIYPVDRRDEATLTALIERHVEPGSRIYSDGWSAYSSLNDRGYEHFTVVHKYAFQKQYRNVLSGEVIKVHTNRIEGAWKHAKDHFKRINGTSMANFEAHLAEIVWRNRSASKNVFHTFFELVRKCYPLDRPRQLCCRDPLFDSWSAGKPGAEGDMNDSVIRCEESAESVENPSPLPVDIPTPPPPPAASSTPIRPNPESRPRYQSKSRCPSNFEPIDDAGDKLKRRGPRHSHVKPKNPYTKDNFTSKFVWSSDDDDFVS